MTTCWNQQDYDACESIPMTASRGPLAARALVIGEEDRARRWASGRLRDAGFEVSTCGDGFEALETARRDPPDLIVVDRAVPHVDARFVLYQLRHDSRTGDVPILFLASSATSALRDVCRRLGVSLLVAQTCEPGVRLRVHPPPVARRRRADSAHLLDLFCERRP